MLYHLCASRKSLLKWSELGFFESWGRQFTWSMANFSSTTLETRSGEIVGDWVKLRPPYLEDYVTVLKFKLFVWMFRELLIHFKFGSFWITKAMYAVKGCGQIVQFDKKSDPRS